jgi:hypothetical protein
MAGTKIAPRSISGPAFMVYQGEGKPYKPFARLNIKKDLRVVALPRPNRSRGRRIFVSAIRDLSIKDKRNSGTTVIKPKGTNCTIAIQIDNDLKMQVKVEGVGNYRNREILVALHPDSELFAGNPIIERSKKLQRDGSAETIAFTTEQVRECESIEVYIKSL